MPSLPLGGTVATAAARHPRTWSSMMTTGDVHGVIVDVDGVLRWASIRRVLGRLLALRTTALRDRRSMLAMPRLVRTLATDLGDAPVFYVTNFAALVAGPIRNLLGRDGYPPGTLLQTGHNLRPRWLLGGSSARKLAALQQLVERTPDVRWVLVGDDGEHDPQVFTDLARHNPN